MAYLAGLFDGEGCISISRKVEPRSTHGTVHRAMVQVANTDRALVECFEHEFGGSIFLISRPGENRQPVWAWRLFRYDPIERFCRLLRPLSRSESKRQQMDVVLKFLETTKDRYCNHRPVPRAVWEKRERLHLECSRLKGPAGRVVAA